MADMRKSDLLDSSDAPRFQAAYARGERNFARWSLAQADLHGLDLRDTIFFDANLMQANLAGADLSRANLGRANLRSANLRNANVSGAFLDGAQLAGADMTGVVTDHPSSQLPKGVNAQSAPVTATQRFCVYCGTTLSTDAIFCRACGEAQPQMPTVTSASSPAAATATTPWPTQNSGPVAQPQSSASSTSPAQASSSVWVTSPVGNSTTSSDVASGRTQSGLRQIVRGLGYGITIIGALGVLIAFFQFPDIAVGEQTFYGVGNYVKTGCNVQVVLPCNTTLTGAGSLSLDPWVWIIPLFAALVALAPLLPARKKPERQGVAILLIGILGIIAVFVQPQVINLVWSRISLGGNLYDPGPSIAVYVLGNPPAMAVGWIIISVGGLIVALF